MTHTYLGISHKKTELYIRTSSATTKFYSTLYTLNAFIPVVSKGFKLSKFPAIWVIFKTLRIKSNPPNFSVMPYYSVYNGAPIIIALKAYIGNLLVQPTKRTIGEDKTSISKLTSACFRKRSTLFCRSSLVFFKSVSSNLACFYTGNAMPHIRQCLYTQRNPNSSR